jgi:hypothetical protein
MKLADKYKFSAPYNRTVYNLSREKFKKGFKPIDVNKVLSEVNKKF